MTVSIWQYLEFKLSDIVNYINKYVCHRYATCKNNNVIFPNYKSNNIMYQANKYFSLFACI